MGLLGRWVGRDAGEAVPGWTGEDRSWRDAEYCVVDLEATGLDLKRDEIVSYGAVLVLHGRIIAATCRYGLVRPEVEISESALTMHGLTSAELAGAPGSAACADDLAAMLRSRVLVAHAAWVERAFLRRLFARRGLRLDGPMVDTAALARELGLAASGPDRREPGLEALAGGLGLPVHTPHHALGDALTTAGVLLALVGRLEQRGPVTVRSLTEISARQGLRP